MKKKKKLPRISNLTRVLDSLDRHPAFSKFCPWPYLLFCRISVTFVDKDGEETHIKVPVGMSMLEAAHENDIELEGTLSRLGTLHLRITRLGSYLYNIPSDRFTESRT